MSETPGETIRRAARQLRNPVFCGDRATPVIAEWLESLDGIEFSETGPMTDELMFALKIARAYLGEAVG